MAGTRLGGQRAAATNKARHGDDFYQNIGRKGGALGTGHDFAYGKLDPREMGRKGGSSGWTPERRKLQAERFRKIGQLRRKP